MKASSSFESLVSVVWLATVVGGLAYFYIHQSWLEHWSVKVAWYCFTHK